MVITNSGAINNTAGSGNGIDGYAHARAIGSAYVVLGDATATTTITNLATGTIKAYHDAIEGTARAQAGGDGSFPRTGRAPAGRQLPAW